jgi:endo-1,4-beta-xylanase
MGESYIPAAFNAAHQADPHAQLYMNEYGLEQDGERWDAFVALVVRLKQQGVPIDGVGLQAHVYSSEDRLSASVLQAHIKILAGLGLKTRISEMDVYDDDGQSVQAEQYAAVFQACLSEPTCVSFTTWGITDRYDHFTDDDGSIQQGHDLLWNDNFSPTPALRALQQLLRPAA